MKTGYKIKDVAERSGFTAATVRYYEEIGLLPLAKRTPAGYRLYDDGTLDRLAFIGRAKQLGCSLDEIADLTIAWDGGRCGPVQDRLRAVVADKLATAQRRTVEFVTLSAQLQRASMMLELHRPDGPCDGTCGCVTDPADVGPLGEGAVSSPIAVSLAKKPERAGTSTPIACTLEPQSMRARLGDWQHVLAHVVRREPLDRGVRAVFGPDAPLDELMRLAAAEQACCQFFAFAITVDTRGIALEVRAPDDGLPVLHAVFGIGS